MVLKIIILKAEKPVDQFVVNGEKTLIGRRSECDISLKDPAVSGNHAEISRVKGRFIITDLGSTNGLHIGGRKITQHVLKDGDLLSVGEHQLKVMLSPGEVGDRAREQMGAREKAAGKAPGVSPDGPDSTEVRARPQTGPAGELQGFLRVLNGANAGQRIELQQALTTIGEPGVQVAAISKRPQGHFIIHVDGGKDKDRVPLVNGEPTGFKSRKLEVGDKIEVAGVNMEYRGSD
ncbi:MAG: FHA domain-containing protein [Proteobacteria bacterium]|nr:FHA domain-containing protein [Pseudomonadota bacterium]